MAASPHSILSAAAARPHTLRGRTQPAKALGSVTSGWFPQLPRRHALHPSKFNWEASPKSARPPIFASTIGSGPDIAASADSQAPINLLITRSFGRLVRSLCLRPSRRPKIIGRGDYGQSGTPLVDGPARFMGAGTYCHFRSIVY